MTFAYLLTYAAIKSFWVPAITAGLIGSYGGGGSKVARQCMALAAAVVAGLILSRLPILPPWPMTGPLGRLPWILAVDGLIFALLIPRLKPISAFMFVSALQTITMAMVCLPFVPRELPSTIMLLAAFMGYGLLLQAQLASRQLSPQDRFWGLAGTALAITVGTGLYPSRTSVHALTVLGGLLGVGLTQRRIADGLSKPAAAYGLTCLLGLAAAILVLTPTVAPVMGVAFTIPLLIAPPFPLGASWRIGFQAAVTLLTLTGVYALSSF